MLHNALHHELALHFYVVGVSSAMSKPKMDSLNQNYLYSFITVLCGGMVRVSEVRLLI